MEKFPNTRYELQQLRADAPFKFGLHLGEHLAVGAAGIPVGEVRYEPSRHQAHHIDPLAMMASIEGRAGRPYVTEVLPFRPMEVNVVLHRDPQEDEGEELLEPMWEFKRDLATQLSEAIDDAKQIGDTGSIYVVGDTSASQIPATAQRVRGTDRPEKAAQAISDISSRGLTFVISDFEALPLRAMRRSHFGATVAVKANHKSELEIPANVGLYPLDGLEEVDTRNAKKLKAANEAIARRHQGLELQLGRTGLSVARAVYDESYSPRLHMRATDKSIAKAVQKLAGQ